MGNLSKSGRPTILKPLKLWRPGADGKKRMLWVYGNPWEGGPRYLRTHRFGEQPQVDRQWESNLSFSGHMSRIPDKPDPVGQPEDLSLRLSSEERDWKKEAASLPSLPSPPPRATLPPALATKREALQKRPPRIKVYFLRTCLF